MIFIDRHGEASNALYSAICDDGRVGVLESKIERRTGRHAVALSSHDAALHTALYLCGAGGGDYVFVPSYTFYSYISAAESARCVPVFIDSEPATRCMSPQALETAFVWSDLQNKLPKAVVIDNAFGNAADFDTLVPLCKAWNVPTVELCLDSPLGTYKNTPCGANCDYGIIGSDKRLLGGGAVLTVCDPQEKQAAQGFAGYRYTDGETHDYRMNNYIAALDCVQDAVTHKLDKRARSNLDALCAKFDFISPKTPYDGCAYALCKNIAAFASVTESGFTAKKPPPVHTMKKYADCFYFEHEQNYSVSERLTDGFLLNVDFSLSARIALFRILSKFI